MLSILLVGYFILCVVDIILSSQQNIVDFDKAYVEYHGIILGSSAHFGAQPDNAETLQRFVTVLHPIADSINASNYTL